jgi:hypothetical protein
MQPRARILALTALLASVVVLPCGLSAQDTRAPLLPGITSADELPNGCVSCHKNEGDGIPLRLNVMLSRIANHPKVDTLIKIVPKDCGMCHKEGAKMGDLPDVVHKAHFGKGADSKFVKLYQGSCLNCHAVNTATGVMSIKGGPKNW